MAVESLLEVSAIDTLLSNFIVPLQEDNIKTSNGRIHASLNINTETGRLSCRRPNLQNQPALEKDRYKVRTNDTQNVKSPSHSYKILIEGETAGVHGHYTQCGALVMSVGACLQVRRTFTADRRDGKTNTLIVADYGQLELRILAHLTNCKSMLDAFKSGGDFHSRTALGMYDEIKGAVEKGKQHMLRKRPRICVTDNPGHVMSHFLGTNSWAGFILPAGWVPDILLLDI